jgi:hypothetical protein
MNRIGESRKNKLPHPEGIGDNSPTFQRWLAVFTGPQKVEKPNFYYPGGIDDKHSLVATFEALKGRELPRSHR